MSKENINDLISSFSAAGVFSAIDIHFARFILDFAEDQDPAIFLAAALVSRTTAGGDICLDLKAVPTASQGDQHAVDGPIACPPARRWRRKLASHPAVGRPGDLRPLILDDGNRLYLYRYWEYENNLAASIRERGAGPPASFSPAKVKAVIDRLFPAVDGDVDWQKIAAVMALLKRFSVITGGPGSGKTYAIAGILALILECTDRDSLRICMAAPTGKAAARLGDAIKQAKENLVCSRAVKDGIPGEVYTLHRLLKPIEGTPYFRHNSDNLLPADVVVVDEASMVDLALMSKLLQAVDRNARLVIAGDKDQLASVEAGSVLGDICDRRVLHGFSQEFVQRVAKLTGIRVDRPAQAPGDGPGLQDCICVLQKNYRFSSQSGIGGISRTINRGDVEGSMKLLKNPAEIAVTWTNINTRDHLNRQLPAVIIEGFRKYLTIRDPVLAMDAFKRFIILCALKVGPFGSESVNGLAEQILRAENLIGSRQAGRGLWYRGRPVMVTRNDYGLDLFNGDIGITLPDPESSDDRLYVFFPGASGGVRRFAPHRLPMHATVYAMTVHKSQGSEFDHVILILPDRDYPLITRELLYTGLTRARREVDIWSTEAVLSAAISRKVKRSSGLREALWD